MRKISAVVLLAQPPPGPNHSNYSNAECDALYEQIRVMPADAPERRACAGGW